MITIQQIYELVRKAMPSCATEEEYCELFDALFNDSIAYYSETGELEFSS